MSAALLEPLRAFDVIATSMGPALQEVDAARDRYALAQASGAILPNVVEAVRVELTYHSNAIEGSTLTLRETQLVIEGRTPPGEKSLREIYEARNHDRALRLIEKWSSDRPAFSLSERDLLDVHAQVLADIDTGYAGRFRDKRVLIAGSGFVPPSPEKFDSLLSAAIGLAIRPAVHPALRAAELHYNLAAVHPFVDGNGRTARLMMNHLLLSHGYPPAIVEVTRRGEYLAALDEANHGRLERFADFIVCGVLIGAKRLLG